MQGERILAIPLVSMLMPTPVELKKQKGGMHDAYGDSSLYVASFSVVMTRPDCVSVVWHKNEWKNKKKTVAAMPLIIGERWRKARSDHEK